MKAGKLLGILGGVIAIVGAVLPWWNVAASAGGIVSVSLPILGIFTPGGILVLVFGILGLIFAMMKSPAMGIATAVMGLLVLVISATLGAFLPIGSVSAGGASVNLTAGFGYWISLIGGLLLLAGGPLVYMDNKKMRMQPAMGPAPMAPPPAM